MFSLFSRHVLIQCSRTSTLVKTATATATLISASAIVPSIAKRSEFVKIMNRAQQQEEGFWYSCKVVLRGIRHIIFWTPLCIIVLPMMYYFASEDRFWNTFLWAVQKSGPAAIKFCQWASTRKDLFPESVCLRFSKLLMRNEYHSFKKTIQTMDLSFGNSWRNEIYLSEDEDPIGSGCIAQVYKATMIKSGEKVAIKVLHPNVQETISMDLKLMSIFATMLNWIPKLKWIGFPEMMTEFSALMKNQTDMRIEAENLKIFNVNFCADKNVQFPVPIDPFVSEHVLVESYFDGILLSDLLQMKGHPYDPKRIASLGLHSFLKMIFLDNFVHADLHPGNIMVIGDPVDPSLVFLDVGLVSVLDSNDRRNFIDLFRAILNGNGKEVGDLLIERSKGHQCTDRLGFSLKVSDLVYRTASTGLKLSQIHIASLIGELLSLCLNYRVKLDSRFVSTIIAASILEGVGRNLDPEINILKASFPYVLS
jgi:aarF domain-containing kinase